jgi:hypothetical protein
VPNSLNDEKSLEFWSESDAEYGQSPKDAVMAASKMSACHGWLHTPRSWLAGRARDDALEPDRPKRRHISMRSDGSRMLCKSPDFSHNRADQELCCRGGRQAGESAGQETFSCLVDSHVTADQEAQLECVNRPGTGRDDPSDNHWSRTGRGAGGHLGLEGGERTTSVIREERGSGLLPYHGDHVQPGSPRLR